MTTTQSFADRVARVPCPACGTQVDVADVEPLSEMDCPRCRSTFTVPGVVGTLELRELLGRGTAGIVYRAFDHELQKEVAVKVFLRTTSPEINNGSATVDVVDKCLTEARAMRALSHPNIVQIYKVDQKGERPFIVMELLTGDRLDKVIDNHLLVEEHRALRMAIDVASGLKAVHDAGFAHLDVKPANIQMDGDGACKLMDYDTARSQREIEEQGAGLVGTPYYVAPEIIRRGAVDFRADIYSLGATLFHLIAQRPPFQGETTRDVVQGRLKRKAMNLHEIRKDVSEVTAAVIAKMLEADPADRYVDYNQLLADLRRAQQMAVDRAMQTPAMAARARTASGGGGGGAMSPSKIAAGAGVAVLLIAIAVWLAVKPGDPSKANGKDSLASGTQRDRSGLDDVNATTRGKDRNNIQPPVAGQDGVKDANDAKVVDPVEKVPPHVPPVPPVTPADKTKSPLENLKPLSPPQPLPEAVIPEPVKPGTIRNEKEVDGWLAGKDVTLSHSANQLTVWATSNPSIRIEGIAGPGDSAEPAILEVRMKATGAGEGKLWWLSEKFPLFSDTRVKPFEIKHDGEWRDYLIAVPAKGEKLELRLDLGGGAGIFEIQWIKFYAKASDTRPARQWRFEPDGRK